MTTRLFLKVAAVCGVALLVGCGGKGDDVVVSSHPLNEPLTITKSSFLNVSPSVGGNVTIEECNLVLTDRSVGDQCEYREMVINPYLYDLWLVPQCESTFVFNSPNVKIVAIRGGGES